MLLLSINDSVDRGWDEFFQWLPKLVGFLIIVLIGYIVARIVGGIVARALGRAGFDRLLARGAGGSYAMRVIDSPSKLLGTLRSGPCSLAHSRSRSTYSGSRHSKT